MLLLFVQGLGMGASSISVDDPITTLCTTGQYVSQLSTTGQYQSALATTGQYRTAIETTGGIAEC